MVRFNYIHTMDWDFKNVEITNCDTIEEFENKISEGKVITISTVDKIKYGINSSYIMYWE